MSVIMTGTGRKSGILKRLWSKGRVRLLFWATLTGLAFGALEAGEPLEDWLRGVRNLARQHDVGGDIVLIAIDDHSIDELQNWPWPRRYLAQLADRLGDSGARSIYFDLDVSSPSDASGDGAFAAAIERLGRKVTLPVRFIVDPITGKRTDSFPYPRFRKNSNLANINARYSHQGVVWKLPYALTYGGKDYPSFAAALADTHGASGEMFPIDYAIDPESVTVVSASDVIQGEVPMATFRGKDTVIATASLQVGDIYLMPGRGQMPGVYLQILGAETLKAGRPTDLGWAVPLLLALALATACVRTRNSRRSGVIALAGGALLLLAPLLLEARGIHAQIVPALLLLIVASATHGWQRFRQSSRERASVNAVSGLPNLNALRERAVTEDEILIAAKVKNYAEICAALPAKDERSLVEQIASRLSVGAPDRILYQGDEGIFIWLDRAGMEEQLDEHLSALHALFRSPVVVAGSRFDLTLAFGVETGKDRSPANRLGGALVAADEAAAASREWKHYEPARPEDAAWKLSLLSQLDAAIENGDLWVAYQPVFDLKTRSLVGAEALVRWAHPEKGQISPMEFVPAAEQNGRIEKLTEFVLDAAIQSAALINRRGVEFNISVNLSPKLLGRFPLEATVVDLLGRHGLDGARLTLEVTETAALATGVGDLASLHSLRGRGVQISIDDYGTGLSTLDYVKRLPATEIKIDQSFVQGIHKSNSDKLMVNSTIQLAHSLGQRVVAEGVEDLSTLETLADMGCDLIQGFYIAKPMTFMELSKILTGKRQSNAA